MMPGGACRLKTEYQTKFCHNPSAYSLATYRNNLAFRRNLRSHSEAHCHIPFVWENDDSECENCADSECDEESFGDGVGNHRPSYVATYQFKHKKWKQLYEKKQLKRLCDKSTQTDLDDGVTWLDINCDNDECQENNDGNASKETQTPEGWYSINKPPFAAYGCKNEAIETGDKKTFNVKAAKEIFPSALRAIRQRDPVAKCVSSSYSMTRNLQSSTPKTAYVTELAPVVMRTSDSREKGFEQIPGSPSLWKTEYESEFRPHKSPDRLFNKALRVKSVDLLPSTPRAHRSYLSIY